MTIASDDGREQTVRDSLPLHIILLGRYRTKSMLLGLCHTDTPTVRR